MVKKKTCVFISGKGSNLKNLISHSRDNNFPINISLVITNIKNAKGIGYPKKYNIPHVDLGGVANYKTLIYYPEDSDGDTILFDSKERFGSETHVEIIQSIRGEIGRFAPKKGKALYFKGDTIHAGNNPINYPVRTVINFDFLVKE